MSAPGPDLFALCRTALGASTQVDDAQVAAWYCGSARLALEQARRELESLTAMVVERERELARRAAPRQLPIQATAKEQSSADSPTRRRAGGA